MDFDDFAKICVLTIAIIFLFLLISVPAVLFKNWQEREDCRLMSQSNFSTQIRTKMVIVQTCYVEDNNVFVPYEKFRSFNTG